VSAAAKRLLLTTCAAAALPGLSAAQSFIPHPQNYLVSVDAVDARSLWLQPAGLSRTRDATLAVFGHGERGGAGGLAQYGALIANGGIAVGWERSREPGGLRADTWTVGAGAGHARAGIGATRSWHRGTGTRDGSFALGGRYAPAGALEMSLLWRDIGSPVILGDTVRATLVPAAALNFLGGRARLSSEWEIVTADWGTSAVRTAASVALPRGTVLTVRAELSGAGDPRSIAVALSWSGRAVRTTAFASDVRGAPDPFGGYLAMVRPLETRRRPGRR